MDKHRYPEDHELRKIRNWEIKHPADAVALLEYIQDIWEFADVGFYEIKNMEYRLSTGGWSGNEEIMNAIQDNKVFWMLCWESSKRGGHYWFKVDLGFNE